MTTMATTRMMPERVSLTSLMVLVLKLDMLYEQALLHETVNLSRMLVILRNT
uniref:Uncharacterized protein n=1 Tax=Medicago truncatula TaxID=3880 RepID=I3S025_MEDTR|nr:unknown [Medicago truncatula]